MWPSLNRRNKLRASSFTTCLLFVVLVFGGVGFYYFRYFQWRWFEDPSADLTYAKVTGSGVNDFRRKTIEALLDPTIQVLDNIKKMRKETKKGTHREEDFEQHYKEIRNRLLEILDEGRLRRIPQQFKPKYVEAMKALKNAYDSVNYLDEALDAETETERTAAYNKSVKEWNEGNKRISMVKDYFKGDQWTYDAAANDN